MHYHWFPVAGNNTAGGQGRTYLTVVDSTLAITPKAIVGL